MRLTIANLSSSVSSAELNDVVQALQEQVSRHFAPEWGRDATVRGVRGAVEEGQFAISGRHDAIIYLGDSVDDPTTGVENALGYHSASQGGVPYGFVYLDICRECEEPWTATLSHEVLELLVDPTAALTVAGPDPTGAPGYIARDLEVCDPTQGDTYLVQGKALSNFVGRAYFGEPGGSGLTNYLGLALAPFGVRPSGYFLYEDGQGVHQIEGALLTERRRNAKARLGLARRARRRKGRTRSPASHAAQTLRQAIACDDGLRERLRQAAASAVRQALRDAGVSVSESDLAEWQGQAHRLPG